MRKAEINEYGAMAVLVVAMMTVPGAALGAGFDCSKARTSVEKTICASEALSRLDEQLAGAYESAIRSSDNPDALRKEQKEWLRKNRDKCRDEACLKNAYEHRLAQLAAPGQPGWTTFRDGNLGIEFSYPSDRQMKIGCHGSTNCVALLGKPVSNSEYLIAFEVFDGDLEKVAVENAVFEKNNDRWIARGRSGEHPVTPLTGPDWQGIKATVDCGVSDSSGFHAGAGECLWVVLSNGKRSVVVDTLGKVGIDESSLQSIQSIRFLR